MRSQQRLAEAAARPEQLGDDQRGHAGCCVHNNAARKIKRADICGQPAAAPDPAGNGEINEDRPEHGEGDDPAEAHALYKGADNQRGCNDRKGHLEQREGGFRQGRSGAQIGKVGEHRIAKAAQPGRSGPEDETIANNGPEQRDGAEDDKAVHDDRQHVLGADKAAIKQPKAGNRHHQHEGRCGQDPRSVTAIGNNFWLRIGSCRKCQRTCNKRC